MQISNAVKACLAINPFTLQLLRNSSFLRPRQPFQLDHDAGRGVLITDPAAYKTRLRQAFDRQTTYDLDSSLYPVLARRLLVHAKLKKGERVLDVATGTGLVALAAAKEVGRSGRVLGIDISKGMLEQAHKKVVAAGIENVDLHHADAEAISMPPGSFDAVLCSSAVPYLANLPATLRTWRTWLRRHPQGRLVFNCFKEPFDPEAGVFYELAHKYGHRVQEANKRTGSPEACKQLLQAAGLFTVQVHEQQLETLSPASSLMQFAQNAWQSSCDNPMHPLRPNAMPAEQLAQFRTEFIERVCMQAAPRMRSQFGGVITYYTVYDVVASA